MEWLRDFWGIIMAGTGGIFWLARLEGRVNMLDRQAERDRKDARDSRNETKDLLRDMQKDIKRLLEKVGTGQ